jgi:hypothetical protein
VDLLVAVGTLDGAIEAVCVVLVGVGFGAVDGSGKDKNDGESSMSSLLLLL